MKKYVTAWILLTVFLLPVHSYASDHGAASEGPSPWKTLETLQEGNLRFRSGRAKHPHQARERVRELASGQKPFAIVFSCSDSRVSPELAFDQGLGDLFVVRNAGHALDPHALGSIEYAVEHLGSKLLVVMGHQSCGAVKATLTTHEGKSTGSANIDAIVSTLRPNLKAFSSDSAKTDPTLTLPVKAHVSATVRDLLKASPMLKNLVDTEKLLVVEAIYELESGKTKFFRIPDETPKSVLGSKRGEARQPSSAAPGAPAASAGDAHHH